MVMKQTIPKVRLIPKALRGALGTEHSCENQGHRRLRRGTEVPLRRLDSRESLILSTEHSCENQGHRWLRRVTEVSLPQAGNPVFTLTVFRAAVHA